MAKRSAPFEAWVDDFIATAAAGMRLPSQRHLAERFGLSPTTINKVLRRQVAAGRLERIPGIGLRLPADEERVLRQPILQPTSLTDHLIDALGRSVWKYGEALPPQRDLGRRFGVGWRAVAAALAELESRGIVHRRGRRFLVGRLATPASGRPGGRVILFGDAAVLAQGDHQRLVAGIEDELIRQDLILLCRPRGDLPLWLDADRLRDQRVAGLLVCQEAQDWGDELHAAWRRFTRTARQCRTRLLSIGRPVPGAAPPPERSDLLTFGSTHTQVCRLAIDSAQALQPRQLTLIHDGQRPLQLKVGLRLFPELQRRLPQLPWRLVIMDPAKESGERFLDAVITSDPAGARYYHELIGKFDNCDLAMVGERLSCWDTAEDFPAVAGDFLVASSGAVALQLVQSRRGTGLPLLSLRDDPGCRLGGIAACKTDWPATAHAVVHALLGDLPVERSSRGYLRPVVRCLPRETLPLMPV